MIWENIALALSSLRANKMRALLTMLGIIIGVASVIAIVLVGDAVEASVNDSMTGFGTSNITASVRERAITQRNMFAMSGTSLLGGFGGGGGGGAAPATIQFDGGGGSTRGVSGKTPETADLISFSMIDDLLDYFGDAVAGVSVSYSGGSATVKERDLYANVSITGVNPDYIVSENTEILAGRYIAESDMTNNSRVAVVSDKLVNNMFGGDMEAALGQQIKLYKTDVIELYTIIGVYKYEQTGFMGSTASEQDISTAVYIPVTTAKQDILEKNYNNITVIAGKDADVKALTDELQAYFDAVYIKNQDFNVSISNMGSMLDSMLDMIGTIKIAIAFIAAISLLVGGIGVMNIMLVSVTERTREIGTRKALGARNFHIRFQFLTEAVIITAVGGFIGITLGVLIGAVISVYLSAPVTVSYVTIIGSAAFSMAIGVFFGLYPANSAAKLNPIDALRYE